MKIIQHILRLFSAILVLLIFNPSVFAEDKPVGLVVALRGEVMALNAGGMRRRLAVKSKIFEEDTIKTGGRGRVQLMFDDNTIISLGPKTEMLIADYQWNPEKTSGAMKTRVNEGVFRIMGGAITQVAPENFKTETPAGTIGIRGSMYAGRIEGASLRLLFQGGKGIYFSNDAGTVNIERPGFGTFVAGPSTAPPAPTRLSSEDMAQLNEVADTSPEDSQQDEGQEPATETQEPSDSGGEPIESDEDVNHDSGVESQIPSDSDSDPAGGEGDQPLEEQKVLEAFDEPAADGDTLLLADSAARTPLQSDTILSPVDTVKDTANQTVIDSIDSVRQEKVLEIEQKILDLLQEMGFSGSRSLSVPDDGIEAFDGVVRHKLLEKQEYEESPAKMLVNWHNKKFFGIVEEDGLPDKKHPIYVFGAVKGTALDNVRVIGSGATVGSNRVSTISGTGYFGQLYGERTDASGFALKGVEVDVQFQGERDEWTAYGAVLSKGEPPPNATTARGTQNWRGFVLGIAEDMAAPEINRRIFSNDNSDKFQLAVNKDKGTISGRLSAVDDNNTVNVIDDLQIGGALDSAYVADDAMFALLGGDNVIASGSGAGDLKQHGNYLVAERNPEQLAPFTTWGYWEIAYRDPETGIDYHVHRPGSYWIAGPQTPASEISNLMATNFVGAYTGGAEGIQIDATGRISELTGGTTNLSIDFHPGASIPVMGNISFDQVNLNLISNMGDVKTNGFSGTISGAVSSKVKGTYFGPNAASIGGKFNARMSVGDEYHGIFAGKRP
jgi:hypothetical protein